MNIFALSSGRGPCGIAIIRLSGPDTLSVCKLISKGKKIKENAYWGEYADTLEWTLPNPPPEHTFETLPTRELWDKSKQH